MQDQLEDLRDCGLLGCRPHFIQGLANIKVSWSISFWSTLKIRFFFLFDNKLTVHSTCHQHTHVSSTTVLLTSRERKRFVKTRSHFLANLFLVRLMVLLLVVVIFQTFFSQNGLLTSIRDFDRLFADDLHVLKSYHRLQVMIIRFCLSHQSGSLIKNRLLSKNMFFLSFKNCSAFTASRKKNLQSNSTYFIVGHTKRI